MATNITDEEWDELSPEHFDTTALLSAVESIKDRTAKWVICSTSQSIWKIKCTA